jgi:hypothetical protein
MINSKKPRYPRKGNLANGHFKDFPVELEARIAENERVRASGGRADFPKVIADLLEDVFQCGVVTADRELGKITTIPRDKERKLMHLVRARTIVAYASRGTTKRDDDLLRDFMHEPAYRAFNDGRSLSANGHHSYASLLDVEPSPKWRRMPFRYEYELYTICQAVHTASRTGNTPMLKRSEHNPGDYYVAPLDAEKLTQSEREDAFSYSISPAASRAFSKAGVLELGSVDQPVAVPSDVMDAFLEQKTVRDGLIAEYEEIKAEGERADIASISRDEAGNYIFPAQDPNRPQTRQNSPYVCVTPISPLDVFGNLLGIHLGNTGLAKFQDGTVYVDLKEQNYLSGPSRHARGVELILHMLSLEGVDFAPYDRERFWTPGNLGMGSDAFRLNGTGSDVLLQQIGHEKDDATIAGWEDKKGLSCVEIETPERRGHERIFLMAEYKNKEELLDVAARLQRSLYSAWGVEPEGSLEP